MYNSGRRSKQNRARLQAISKKQKSLNKIVNRKRLDTEDVPTVREDEMNRIEQNKEEVEEKNIPKKLKRATNLVAGIKGYTLSNSDEVLLDECTIRSYKAGKDDTSHSGARLIHEPTGLQVESQKYDYFEKNQRHALSLLRIQLRDFLSGEEERIERRGGLSFEDKRILEKKRKRNKKVFRGKFNPDDLIESEDELFGE